MIKSPDYLNAENHFWVVAEIDRCLTVMATITVFVDYVNTNISGKQLTQLDNLHVIGRNKCLMSA